MAVKSCLRLPPPVAVGSQSAEFDGGKTLRPQIRAVHTGIARLDLFMAVLFKMAGTITYLSDDFRFFMNSPFYCSP